MQINPVLLQKCMYGHSRRKAKHLANVRFGQRLGPISLERERFERHTRWALSLGRDALRDLVGNL